MLCETQLGAADPRQVAWIALRATQNRCAFTTLGYRVQSQSFQLLFPDLTPQSDNSAITISAAPRVSDRPGRHIAP